jgi:hypothetical protein
MTLKSRAEIAAAAIVHRMIMRKRPLAFLLVVPLNKGSAAVVAAAMTAKGIKSQSIWEITASHRKMLQHTLLCSTQGKQITARWCIAGLGGQEHQNPPRAHSPRPPTGQSERG